MKALNIDITNKFKPLKPCKDHNEIPRIIRRTKDGFTTAECNQGCLIFTFENESSLNFKWNEYYGSK